MIKGLKITIAKLSPQGGIPYAEQTIYNLQTVCVLFGVLCLRIEICNLLFLLFY